MDSDEALLGQLLEGDLRAFDRLYNRFERPLLGFIRLQLGSAEEAEDVVQETFVALLRDREKIENLRSFRAWLFEVARNLCLNRVRAHHRAERAQDATRRAGEAAPEPASAEGQLETRQQLAWLQEAIGRLPLPLAEVYRLRAAGMSLEEVASVLEVPLGTVKSRMHEMVKRLRREVPS
jgi:RNA polymerase sigma-70 factor (ECF subfamily)